MNVVDSSFVGRDCALQLNIQGGEKNMIEVEQPSVHLWKESGIASLETGFEPLRKAKTLNLHYINTASMLNREIRLKTH